MVNGELVFYSFTIFPALNTCALSSGVMRVVLPNNITNDVTPVGGIPLMCNNSGSGGCPAGTTTAPVRCLPISYTVNINDVDKLPQVTCVPNRLEAQAQYRNGTQFTSPASFPILVDVPLCNAVVSAGPNSWTDSSGKWETSANWSLGAPPSSAQSATFITNANTKTVTIDAITAGSSPAAMTISNLTLSGPVGTINTLSLTNAGLATPLRIFNVLGLNSGGVLLITNSALRVDGGFNLDGIATLNGGVISVTNPFPSSLHISDSGSGQMAVSNGILQANVEFVGFFGSSSGTLTLAGGTNFVGVGGLNVSGFAGTTGTVWVTGGSLVVTNAISFNVGSSGVGKMAVSNGVVQGGGVVVGFNPGSVGTITATGGNMIFTNASNTGSIDVRRGAFTMSGGSVAVDQLFVTNGAAGLFNLNGGTLTSGSTTVSNGSFLASFVVGNGSTPATLNLFRGNHLFYDGLIIGANAIGSTGSVWMSGTQLSVPNGATVVGNTFGTGQLTVSNGTVLTSETAVGANFRGQGTLTLTAGAITSSSNLLVGSDLFATGTVWITGGQLTVTNGLSEIGDGGVGRLIISNGMGVASSMLVGYFGGQGLLVIVGGTEAISSNLVIGDCAAGGATGAVTVTGGSLYVTNAEHSAVLEVRNGRLILNSGLLQVDKLVMTNSCGLFVRSGGTLIINTKVLDPNLDADGDGIPNGFEQAYGLDPLNAADANLDNDGDGMSNLQEYLAGTDPTNSASSFRVTSVTRTGNDVAVTWTMGSGKTNAVQFDNGANYTTNFTDLFIVTNTLGTVTNYLDVGGATNTPARYYRVRLVP